MKDLMTRKIVFGMLLMFVLAFGVPGVVDAIKFSSTSTQPNSDIVTYRVVGNTFRINTGFTFEATDTRESVEIDGLDGITLIGSLHNATVSSNSLTLTEIDDDTNDMSNGSKFSFTRSTGGSGEVSRSFTIEGRFTGTGKKTVTITPSGKTAKNYIYHVVAAATGSISFLNTDGTTPNATGYIINAYADGDMQIVSGTDGGTLPVLYTPRGSLRVYHTDLKDNIMDFPGGSNPISNAFGVYIRKGKTTVRVIAEVRDGSTTEAVYIYGTPTLDVDGPTGSEKGSQDNPGKSGELIQNVITATVKDGKNGGVPGTVVRFGPSTNNNLFFDSSNNGELVAHDGSTGFSIIRDGTNQVTAGSGSTLYVRTNSSGKASVDFLFGDANDTVNVTVVDAIGSPVTSSTGFNHNGQNITLHVGSSGTQLSVFRVDNRSGNSNIFDLHALVEKDGVAPTGAELRNNITTPDDTTDTTDTLGDGEFDVLFTTDDGRLTNTPSSDGFVTTPSATSGSTIWERPDTNGIAKVEFVSDDSSSNPQVTAKFQKIVNSVRIDVQTVTFDITGSGDPPPPPPQTARLSINATGTGTTRSVSVTATNAQGAVVPGLFVTLSGSALPAGSQNVSAGTSTTITLPSTPGNYTLIAAASGYTSDTETLTITAPGTLSLEEVGARAANGGQSIRVTVREATGSLASGAVTVTLSGAVSRTVPTTNGTGAAVITVPTTGGAVTLRATGYTTSSYTFSTTGQPTTPTTTPTGPAGVADSVRIASDPFTSGTANTRLAQPLRVQVLDANGNGVANVRVTFQVVSGQGRLSQRGNGRAVRANTDRNGNASANYTPLADGTSRVRATAADVTQTVTFTITAGAAAPSPDDTTPSETDVTPSREINPVVQVNASQRPPMLWVDGGSIYALVGADVQEFASGVDNALNIAVAAGKVYWTEQTGDSAGTINSANLNGSNVKELKSIMAVPMGIAVDTAGDKLYWTNSRGRIQSLNADGSGRVENVMLDLPGPRDIAVARGNLYWTQYDATEGEGNVGIVNPNSAQKVARYTSTGSDAPGSLTVAGGKIYWTEMTGTSSGTINSANLNGTNAMELASIRAVPIGIGVDGARSKLYWTNSRGRVQSANLDGSKIQNVVDGLGSPGDMVLSNSIAAPAATATPTTPTTASNKYDVNGDGSVDSKDVDALIVAVAAGVTDAKYDVNGDGKVDIFDVSAVSSKRDDGAASAPTLLGTKLSIVQIDRLQEQIDLLVASNDRSPDALRILTYLHQLIVMARPEKTQLLANYPNPFNPETWIPYELATDTTVKITIYNTHGVVIRTLALGHQSAGYYTGRDRAAYWDGRNALGEQVASGIYFYRFETDEMSSMRKMVILK